MLRLRNTEDILTHETDKKQMMILYFIPDGRGYNRYDYGNVLGLTNSISIYHIIIDAVILFCWKKFKRDQVPSGG